MDPNFQIEEELKTNYESFKRMNDPLIFGNLKTQTHTFVIDSRKLQHKEKILQDTNLILETTKINEQKEQSLYDEISRDTRQDIINSAPQLQQQEQILQNLTKKRQELLQQKEALEYKLKCVQYNYSKQKEVLQQVKMKNELSSKIVSMRGDLDVGVLICNKEIIPFNMKGMKREERKQYLCDLLLHYDFN